MTTTSPGTVLVTGAARRIGRAIALDVAELGEVDALSILENSRREAFKHEVAATNCRGFVKLTRLTMKSR